MKESERKARIKWLGDAQTAAVRCRVRKSMSYMNISIEQKGFEFIDSRRKLYLRRIKPGMKQKFCKFGYEIVPCDRTISNSIINKLSRRI